jgi:hypothetical protein
VLELKQNVSELNDSIKKCYKAIEATNDERAAGKALNNELIGKIESLESE